MVNNEIPAIMVGRVKNKQLYAQQMKLLDMAAKAYAQNNMKIGLSLEQEADEYYKKNYNRMFTRS